MNQLDDFERFIKETNYFTSLGDDDEESLPSYLIPNYSSVVGRGSNGEQDTIREAYCSGNYTSIRELPDHLKPGEVNFKKHLKQISAHRSTVNPEDVLRMRRASVKRNGLFRDFEYIPSRYTLQKEQESKARLDSKAKAIQLGGGREFVCPGGSRKLKHEDGFVGSSFQYAYKSDPFEAQHDQEMEEKWNHRSKILFGAFVPSGKVGMESNNTTVMMQDEIVTRIQEILLKDWDGCPFLVSVGEDGNIAVQFELIPLEGQEHGLKAYMNTLQSSNYDISKFGLRRVSQVWHKIPGDGFIYYLFRPPWVKTTVTLE